MKKIGKRFKKYGFIFDLVKRKGCVAIYKQTLPGAKKHHYEVVRIGQHNGYYMAGQKIEPAETYPGNSLWGIQGWTCLDLESAKKCFDKACTRFNKKLQHA